MSQPDVITAVLTEACRAPSSHNTQPWIFRVDGSVVELHADRTRALPVTDPDDRELVISCGAALFSLRAAAAAAGFGCAVSRFPVAADPDLLARVELTTEEVDAEAGALAAALPHRRTHRRPFDAESLDAELAAMITSAVASEGAALLPVAGGQRGEVIGLVGEGDRVQWDDPRWRRELAMWMHPRRRGDGLVVPALAAPMARAVIRTFDLGDGTAAKDEALAAGSPWLTVLATREDAPHAWLQAGEALQRALLVACRAGVQASYLNQPIEVPALRARLRGVLGTSLHPQLLVRWGRVSAASSASSSASPRRPLSAVLWSPLSET